MSEPLSSDLLRFVCTQHLDPGALAAAFLHWFDDREQERVARLRRAEDRRDFIAAHALLRATLGELTGSSPARLQLVVDRSGKPRLERDGPAFSLTHCSGLVSCAVARAGASSAIGVDAEPSSSSGRLRTMVEAFAAPEERAWLRERPDLLDRRLLELWTAKEAVQKARGTGIADPDASLAEVPCRHREDRGAGLACYVVDAEQEVRCWHLASGHALSLARPLRHDGWASPQACSLDSARLVPAARSQG